MIGFWAADVRAACARRPLGACGPMPRQTRCCTWPSKLDVPRALSEASIAAARSATICHSVPSISTNPWERFGPGEAVRGRGRVAAGRAGKPRVKPSGCSDLPTAPDDDVWRGQLQIPEARNHRFFVSTLAEFREALMTRCAEDDHGEMDEDEDSEDGEDDGEAAE